MIICTFYHTYRIHSYNFLFSNLYNPIQSNLLRRSTNYRERIRGRELDLAGLCARQKPRQNRTPAQDQPPQHKDYVLFPANIAVIKKYRVSHNPCSCLHIYIYIGRQGQGDIDRERERLMSLLRHLWEYGIFAWIDIFVG